MSNNSIKNNGFEQLDLKSLCLCNKDYGFEMEHVELHLKRATGPPDEAISYPRPSTK